MKRHRINSSFHYVLVVLMILSFMLPLALSGGQAAAQTAGVKEQTYTGTVTNISKGGTQWTVGATVVLVNAATRLERFPTQGDEVSVRGQLQSNGSVLASRIRVVHLMGGKAKPAAQPVTLPVVQPAVAPVVAPPAPASVTETRFTAKVNGTGTNMWLIGLTPVAIDANTKMIGNPAFGLNAEVRGIQQANGIVLATLIRSLSGSGGASIGTPVRFTATVEDVASTSWVIGGFTLTVNEKTKMIDNPREGVSVEVIATQQGGTALLATEIRNMSGIAPVSGAAPVAAPSGGGTSGGGASGGSGTSGGSGSVSGSGGGTSGGSGGSGSGSGGSGGGSGGSGSGSGGSGSGSGGSG